MKLLENYFNTKIEVIFAGPKILKESEITVDSITTCFHFYDSKWY
jgi:hypothetical protein